jgi:putative ABC transport system permease protein
MKYLPLLWAGLWRKPIRTVLTVLSIAVAFLLFGILNGVIAGFDGALSKMSETRLRVMNRANILEAMPISYEARIAKVPGVRSVSHFAILVAYYQDPKNGFSASAMDIDQSIAVFPEIKVPDDQVEAMRRTRSGAIVGVDLAKRFGWKIGDRITVHSMNWIKEDGSPEWTLDIVGFANAGPHDERIFANELYFNYDYLDTARATGKGTVHQFAASIDDASRATEIAVAIDKLFANSSAETTTLNDREYVVAQVRQIGDVRMFVNSIIGAVLFTLLFLAGNTMSQSVNDRVPELGVLKTLGFSDTAVLLLVVVEAAILCLMAAAIGLAIAATVFKGVFGSLNFTSPIPLPPRVYAFGFGIALLLGALSATIPAIRARRLTIVEALSGR